jgi:8-oxo-dGTP pyrophosphatase MutT (NUDIX family)
MTISPVRPASTVVLMRDAPALEVFLVRRHHAMAFMAGAHVFPGGRVDDADRLADPDAICSGVSTAVANLPDTPPAEAVALHVAAIRELFEEAGVLLATERTGAMVSAGDGRFDESRRRLLAGDIAIADVARAERLTLALDGLMPFARWVTPDAEPRRFDTRFFVAIAPADQRASHDNGETVDGTWTTPADALADAARGHIALPPPTWTTLRHLSRARSASDAWSWARAQSVVRVQPRLILRNDGTRLIALPGDELCPAVNGFEAEETRFVLEQGRWRTADGS